MGTPRRHKLFYSSRLGREEGATAILIALLALFVLLPLAGLSTSSFIRSGTQAELNLAADAGALAGAANIPMGDLAFVVTYVNSFAQVRACPPLPCDQVPPNDAIDPNNPNDAINEQIEMILPGKPNPITIACDQAEAALERNGRLGDAFGTEAPFCSANYIVDPDFLTAFGACVNVIGTNPVGPALKGLADSLPALLKPGISVTFTRRVDPPLESLIGETDVQHRVTSHARRRFKNAVVVPVLPSIPPTSTVIDLDPFVTQTVTVDVPGQDPNVIPLNEVVGQRREDVLDRIDAIEDAIDGYNDMVGPLGTPLPDFPSACRGVLPALRDDFVDVANPPEGEPSPLEIVAPSPATDPNALVLRLFVGTPFFDFVPVCVAGSGGNLAGLAGPTGAGCTANAPGAFRATLVRPDS